MPILKFKDISSALGRDIDDLILEKYRTDEMSAAEIADFIFKKTRIKITTRSIQRRIKKMGITRSLSDAFNTAIKKGRKNYDHLRRPIKSSSFRKGISLGLRFEVFQRDKSRCAICGKSASDDTLVVDHIVSVVNGGTNDLGNLRVLCRECNHGKMILEEKV